MTNTKDILKDGATKVENFVKKTVEKIKEAPNNLLGNEDKPLSPVDGNNPEPSMEDIRRIEEEERKRREAEDPKIAEKQASIAHGLASMIQDQVLHGQVPKAPSVGEDLTNFHYAENTAAHERILTKEVNKKNANFVANLISKAPHSASKDETSDPSS